MNSTEICAALQSLRLGAAWSVRGNLYSDIVWLDTQQTLPTQAELEAEITRLANAAVAEQQRISECKNDSGQADLLQRLQTATSAQIDTWLTNNVTNLAQARAVLAAMIKFLVARGLFR